MASIPRFSAEIDLTDELGLLCEHYVTYNPEGTRSLLAALNLRPKTDRVAGDGSGGGQVFDMAIYRATGNRKLASLFGSVL